MFTTATTPHQIETIARLANAIWFDHYVPIIGKEQTAYMVENLQSPKAIQRQIKEENLRYFLIEDEDRPVGYLAVQPNEDALVLSKLYVEESVRGQGLGREAIGFVEQLAEEFGKKVITLTVNRYNAGSIAAYSRCGFRIVDERITDIGGGFVMDDYVMQKDL